MLDQCTTSHILFLLLSLRLKGNLFFAFLPFSLSFECHSLQHHISPAIIFTTLVTFDFSLMLNPELYPSAFENAYRIYLLNATAFIKFSAFLMRHLFKGGV